MTSEVAARAIGYSGLNGPARTTLSAMKKYGLLDEAKDTFHISERGLRIVASPSGSAEQLDAIREAAMYPDIFRELASSHLDASDEALKSHLLIKKKFTDEGAKAFIRAFRDTVEIAKLKDAVYDAPKQQMEGAMAQETHIHAQGTQVQQSQRPEQLLSCKLGKNVTAEIRIIGDELKPSHLEGLLEYIDLTRKMLEREQG